MRKLRTWRYPYAILCSLVLGMTLVLVWKRQQDLEQILASYQQDEELKARAIAGELEATFKHLYQGLRTISLLPGVRTLDRYATQFGQDSAIAVQQIYNNTYLNVKLSEVYFLPHSFDPEALDPHTGRPEAPILSFDQLITNASPRQPHSSEAQQGPEEVEIFEYRTMAQHISSLKQDYPSTKSFPDLAVPALLSTPVVSCDNSAFTQEDLDRGNDYPRLAFVYTLPFYRKDGSFAGAVSGVVRLAVIDGILPLQWYSFHNTSKTFRTAREPSSELQSYLERGSIDRSSSLYSQTLPVRISGTESWQLSIVKPAAEYWNLPAVSHVENFFRAGLLALLGLTLLGGYIIRSTLARQEILNRLVVKKTQELQLRNHEMSLILSNAAQVFVRIDRSGKILPGYSPCFVQWFGAMPPDVHLWDYLFQEAKLQGIRGLFRLAWHQLEHSELPLDVKLQQIPSEFVLDHRTYKISVSLAYDAKGLASGYLATITDYSEARQTELKEARLKEMLKVYETMMHDRSAVVDFLQEAKLLLAKLGPSASNHSRAELLRALHTLKGNCLLYGLRQLAELCHRAEDELQSSPTGELSPSIQADLNLLWDDYSSKLVPLLDRSVPQEVYLSHQELTAILNRLRATNIPVDILEQMERWHHDPVRPRLEILAKQARNLALHLGKGEPDVLLEDQNVRLDTQRFGALLASFIHIIRNAVDHGLRDAEDEIPNRIHIRVEYLSLTWIRFTFSDNGLGLDLDRIAERAQSLGISIATQEDLLHSIFLDNFSTKSSTNEISGRGVGLAAVRHALLECGGRLKVETTQNAGTQFIFDIPISPKIEPFRKIG